MAKRASQEKFLALEEGRIFCVQWGRGKEKTTVSKKAGKRDQIVACCHCFLALDSLEIPFYTRAKRSSWLSRKLDCFMDWKGTHLEIASHVGWHQKRQHPQRSG